MELAGGGNADAHDFPEIVDVVGSATYAEAPEVDHAALSRPEEGMGRQGVGIALAHDLSEVVDVAGNAIGSAEGPEVGDTYRALRRKRLTYDQDYRNDGQDCQSISDSPHHDCLLHRFHGPR